MRNLVGFQQMKFTLQKPYLTSTPSTRTNLDPRVPSDHFCTFQISVISSFSVHTFAFHFLSLFFSFSFCFAHPQFSTFLFFFTSHFTLGFFKPLSHLYSSSNAGDRKQNRKIKSQAEEGPLYSNTCYLCIYTSLHILTFFTASHLLVFLLLLILLL